MFCPSISTFSTSLPFAFSDVCLATGVANNVPFRLAMLTCCGSANVHTTTDFCYTYCNITVAADISSWSSCLADNIDQTDFNELDLGCVADFPDDGSASTGAVGAIATTWPAQQVVATVLSSGNVIATNTVSGTSIQQASTSTNVIAASATSCKAQGSKCSLATSATPSTVAKNAGRSVFNGRKFKAMSALICFMNLAVIF